MHMIFSCRRKLFQSKTNANPSSMIDKIKNLRFIQSLRISVADEASLVGLELVNNKISKKIFAISLEEIDRML